VELWWYQSSLDRVDSVKYAEVFGIGKYPAQQGLCMLERTPTPSLARKGFKQVRCVNGFEVAQANRADVRFVTV